MKIKSVDHIPLASGAGMLVDLQYRQSGELRPTRILPKKLRIHKTEILGKKDTELQA